MPSGSVQMGRRPGASHTRGFGALLAAGLVLVGVATACGAEESRAEIEARERLAEEFGPRGASEGSVQPASGSDPASPGADPPEAERAPSEPPSGPDAPVSSADAPVRPAPAGSGSEAPARDPAGDADPTPGRAGDQPPEGAPGDGDPARPVVAGSVDPDSILAVADEAYARLTSLRAAFAQRTENPLIGRTREGSGMWYQAGRNRFLMDFEDPPDDIIVADGTCLWWYEPSLQPDQLPARALEEGAEIGTIDILGSLLSEARRSYDGVYVGEEDVAGTPTHHVSLTPRELPARYLDIQVWIGASDALVRRFRIEEENRTVRTVTLSRLEPQADLPDSLFEFVPPAGVPVFSSDPQCA